MGTITIACASSGVGKLCSLTSAILNEVYKANAGFGLGHPLAGRGSPQLLKPIGIRPYDIAVAAALHRSLNPSNERAALGRALIN